MTVSGYATDVLVDADWATQHLTDPAVRFVEVDVDTTSYEQSHLPGAVAWNWTSQLADGIRRDIASREEFSRLLGESGIGPATTIVLYGDNNNWFAAWAYWQVQPVGHIPGAASIRWAQTVREDGTFKSRDELANLYEAKGITADKDVIAYCRIGERSSHSWFVLHELLGYKRVRNYDGSWTEYGSLIGVPIEKPVAVGAGA